MNQIQVCFGFMATRASYCHGPWRFPPLEVVLLWWSRAYTKALIQCVHGVCLRRQTLLQAEWLRLFWAVAVFITVWRVAELACC